VRDLTKQPAQSIPTLVAADGSEAYTDSAKANLLQKQYAAAWTTGGALKELRAHCTDEHCPHFCQPRWVTKQLLGLRRDKATGVDGLPPFFLKKLAKDLGPPLAAVINRSVKDGVVPKQWKEARVVPIPKKGQSSNPADYRPVSILPAVSHICERHVMSILGPAVERGPPEFQYGFRKARSTEDALLRIEAAVCQGWDRCRKLGRSTQVAVVALDMTKAFDKLPHTQIMSALRKRFQVPACIDNWLVSFLSHRTQWVQVGADKSVTLPVLSGCAQGSVTGPVLFNAATAEVGDAQVSDLTSRVVYADDWTLVRAITSDGCLAELEADVGTTVRAIERTGNVVNAKKTGFLLASLDTRTARIGPTITVMGEAIPATQELRVLGVTLDATMQFIGHIKGKTVAARRMLGHIGGVLRRWHMPGVIAHIYNTCIRPAMCYATVLTYGVSRGGDDMYDRVDRLAARLTGGTVASRRAPHSSSSGRLAAEVRRRRVQLAHQYAHGHRHAPPDIRIAPPITTTRTRSQDTAPKLVPSPISSLARASQCSIRRMISEYNHMPPCVRSSSARDPSGLM
jgi:hypothetical protein